jgi:hypothetical protein
VSHFHSYTPTLAGAVFDGALTGLACFLLLAGPLWLAQWCALFFGPESDD